MFDQDEVALLEAAALSSGASLPPLDGFDVQTKALKIVESWGGVERRGLDYNIRIARAFEDVAGSRAEGAVNDKIRSLLIQIAAAGAVPGGGPVEQDFAAMTLTPGTVADLVVARTDDTITTDPLNANTAPTSWSLLESGEPAAGDYTIRIKRTTASGDVGLLGGVKTANGISGFGMLGDGTDYESADGVFSNLLAGANPTLMVITFTIKADLTIAGAVTVVNYDASGNRSGEATITPTVATVTDIGLWVRRFIGAGGQQNWEGLVDINRVDALAA